jgi:penicillin-binding protein 1C
MQMNFRFIKNRGRIRLALWIISGILLISYIFCLPEPLFNEPASTVIEDKDGYLIGAKIAQDGQWRFPFNDRVPEKFKVALIQFEDRKFYYHPGINLFSLIRATIQNLKKGEIVSGGSTITMQVIRLSRKGKPRTVFEKIIEMILATRLEIRYSKSTILAMYAANAPFGGNVVGLDAASWRYFGRSPDDLSWSECATLAVLPNAPSLIYPGKNHEKLRAKRNLLIDWLIKKGFVDKITGDLAKLESLPDKPLKLEQPAPHLLERIYKEKPGQRIRTTIDYSLQKTISEIVEFHHRELEFNEIHNAAALVIESETGNIIAYIGNTINTDSIEHGNDVDIITSPRSSGSILKPFLYAAMLDGGELLPNTLVADIPTQFGGMTPGNFDGTFSGAVPAGMALSRSLNVPAVRMLRQFGVQHFYDVLKSCGFTTLKQPADYYGLSLILGGAETSLWDLGTAYSGLSRELNHFASNSGLYDPHDWRSAVYIADTNRKTESTDEMHSLERNGVLSAASVWFTFKAMREVNRPPEHTGWKSFSSSGKIAWKTGTSFGFRDAWALGVTPEYIVAVWVGNADGEGRSGLTGISSAAPIMFDIFNVLPQTSWFDPPYDEMTKIAVCRQSGCRSNPYCEPVDSCWVPLTGMKTAACPYHHVIHLDKSGNNRVTGDCYDPAEMIHVSWFILPPVIEWFYKKRNPMYKSIPPLSEGCRNDKSLTPMEFIYPGENSKLYLPVGLDGTQGSIILEVAHRNSKALLFWHLDNDYIGMTQNIHQMPFQPSFGKHRITITDESGKSITKEIEILKPDHK